jgi:hypothetical protein
MTSKIENAVLSLASDIAKEMHEEHFDSRRGVGVVDGESLLYFYDNNPYADDAGRRDREHAEMHAALARVGAELLATGSYPPEGAEQAGYTVAHVYDCTDPEGAKREAINIFPGIASGTVRSLN